MFWRFLWNPQRSRHDVPKTIWYLPCIPINTKICADCFYVQSVSSKIFNKFIEHVADSKYSFEPDNKFTDFFPICLMYEMIYVHIITYDFHWIKWWSKIVATCVTFFIDLDNLAFRFWFWLITFFWSKMRGICSKFTL